MTACEIYASLVDGIDLGVVGRANQYLFGRNGTHPRTSWYLTHPDMSVLGVGVIVVGSQVVVIV